MYNLIIINCDGYISKQIFKYLELCIMKIIKFSLFRIVDGLKFYIIYDLKN